MEYELMKQGKSMTAVKQIMDRMIAANSRPSRAEQANGCMK